MVNSLNRDEEGVYTKVQTQTYHRIHLLLSHCPVPYPHTLSVLGQPQKLPRQNAK